MSEGPDYEVAVTNKEKVRVATASARARKHRLILTTGVLNGTEFRLELDAHLVGRAGDADIKLVSESVSRHHARLTRRQDEYSIEDLESQHGIYLNGLRVQSAVLRDGDALQLADVILRYEEF